MMRLPSWASLPAYLCLDIIRKLGPTIHGSHAHVRAALRKTRGATLPFTRQCKALIFHHFRQGHLPLKGRFHRADLLGDGCLEPLLGAAYDLCRARDTKP